MVNKCNYPDDTEQGKKDINSTGLKSSKGLDEESLLKAELEYLVLLKKVAIALLVYVYNSNDGDNRNDLRNKEKRLLIEDVASSKECTSSVKSYVLYTDVFVKRGGTSTSACHNVDISRYRNGGPESKVSTLTFDNSLQPRRSRTDFFPDNFENNGNCIERDDGKERKRVIKILPPKESNTSVKPYVFYKSVFVQDDGTENSTYLKINDKKIWSEKFPDNFEDNGNSVESEERKIVISIVPSKERNSSGKAYVFYKSVFVQDGGTESSASLEMHKSRYYTGNFGSNISTLSVGYSWKPNSNRPEILPSNSEHNFDKVKLLIKFNESGSEKSGFDSSLIFALHNKKFAIIIEEYNVDKLNKNSSKYMRRNFN